MKYKVRMTDGQTALGPAFDGCHTLFLDWFNQERIFLPMGDFDPLPISLDDAKKYVESHKKTLGLFLQEAEMIGSP